MCFSFAHFVSIFLFEVVLKQLLHPLIEGFKNFVNFCSLKLGIHLMIMQFLSILIFCCLKKCRDLKLEEKNKQSLSTSCLFVCFFLKKKTNK